MILLLVIAAWILVVSMVAGLCAAARTGDIAQLAHASAPIGWGESPAWEPVEHLEISARANLRPVRSAEPGAALLHSDGVAA
ncbi:MAG: hypothetical protein ACLPUT_02050 [Solirubrobacteraceae bacterium]